MAYLKINNYVVPVAGGESDNYKEAGIRGRSPNNNYFLNRAGKDKRHWTFETAPLSQADAQSLIGMLQMRGEHFPYWSTDEEDGAGDGSQRSQKGLAQSSGSGNSRTHGNRAADGALVYVLGGSLISPYQDFTGHSTFVNEGCLWPGVSATNVLSAGNANPETSADLSIWSSGTLATETARKWTGAGCVKWTPGANQGGLRTTADLDLSPSTRYVASAFVRGSVPNQQVDILAYDGVSYFAQSTVQVLPASTDTWTRIWVVGTTAVAPVNTGYIGVRSNNAVGGPNIFYVDGLSLHAQTSNPIPNAWTEGQTDIGTISLAYDSTFLKEMTDGLTVNFWVQALDTAYTNAIIVLASDTILNWVRFYINATTGKLSVDISDSADPQRAYWSFSAISTTTIDNSWHMATATFDPIIQTLKLYIDGVLEATDTVNSDYRAVNWADPDVSSVALNVGHQASAVANLGCLLSHLSYLPYTASPNIIAGWFGNGASTDDALSFFPLRCSGDFLAADQRSTLAFGEVLDVNNVPVVESGTWKTNYKKIKFALHEA